MGALIDFILDNIFFVIVALGIITSLFSKGQKGAEDRMPSFGGDDRKGGRRVPKRELVETRQAKERQGSLFEPEPVRPAAGPSRPVKQPVYQSKFESARASEPPAAATAPQPAAAPTSARAMPPVTNAAPISDKSSPIYRAADARDLRRRAVEGMMWSEIYGKPRAFAKHRSPRG